MLMCVRSSGVVDGLLSGSSGWRNVCQVVLRVLLDELDERLEATVAVEVEEFLRACLLELQRGEAADLEVDGRRKVILSRVHLGAVR